MEKSFSNEESSSNEDSTPIDDLYLMYSMAGLRPVGKNYNPCMSIIAKRYATLTNTEVDVERIKNRLQQYYDFDAAAKISGEDTLSNDVYPLEHSSSSAEKIEEKTEAFESKSVGSLDGGATPEIVSRYIILPSELQPFSEEKIEEKTEAFESKRVRISDGGATPEIVSRYIGQPMEQPSFSEKLIEEIFPPKDVVTVDGGVAPEITPNKEMPLDHPSFSAEKIEEKMGSFQSKDVETPDRDATSAGEFRPVELPSFAEETFKEKKEADQSKGIGSLGDGATRYIVQPLEIFPPEDVGTLDGGVTPDMTQNKELPLENSSFSAEKIEEKIGSFQSKDVESPDCDATSADEFRPVELSSFSEEKFEEKKEADESKGIGSLGDGATRYIVQSLEIFPPEDVGTLDGGVTPEMTQNKELPLENSSFSAEKIEEKIGSFQSKDVESPDCDATSADEFCPVELSSFSEEKFEEKKEADQSKGIGSLGDGATRYIVQPLEIFPPKDVGTFDGGMTPEMTQNNELPLENSSFSAEKIEEKIGSFQSKGVETLDGGSTPDKPDQNKKLSLEHLSFSEEMIKEKTEVFLSKDVGAFDGGATPEITQNKEQPLEHPTFSEEMIEDKKAAFNSNGVGPPNGVASTPELSSPLEHTSSIPETIHETKAAVKCKRVAKTLKKSDPKTALKFIWVETPEGVVGAYEPCKAASIESNDQASEAVVASPKFSTPKRKSYSKKDESSPTNKDSKRLRSRVSPVRGKIKVVRSGRAKPKEVETSNVPIIHQVPPKTASKTVTAKKTKKTRSFGRRQAKKTLVGQNKRSTRANNARGVGSPDVHAVTPNDFQTSEHSVRSPEIFRINPEVIDLTKDDTENVGTPYCRASTSSGHFETPSSSYSFPGQAVPTQASTSNSAPVDIFSNQRELLSALGYALIRDLLSTPDYFLTTSERFFERPSRYGVNPETIDLTNDGPEWPGTSNYGYARESEEAAMHNHAASAGSSFRMRHASTTVPESDDSAWFGNSNDRTVTPSTSRRTNARDSEEARMYGHAVSSGGPFRTQRPRTSDYERARTSYGCSSSNPPMDVSFETRRIRSQGTEGNWNETGRAMTTDGSSRNVRDFKNVGTKNDRAETAHGSVRTRRIKRNPQ